MRVLMLATAAYCFATFGELLAQKVQVDTKERGLANMSKVDKERLIKLFPRTNITRLSEKLQKMRLKSKDRLKLDTKTQQELEQLLKIYRQKPNITQGQINSIQEINAKAGITEFMYQGDILMTEDQIDALINVEPSGNRVRRQAFRGTTWGNTVYYYFDASASAEVRDVFVKAVQIWQANTCINFLESNSAANRIRVFKGEGCYAFFGMTTGVHDLSIGSGCELVGTALHEIGHALGFYHTQGRSDRDDNIIVNVHNIEGQDDIQFIKYTSTQNNNYGLDYDYGSVMHYGGKAFTANDLPTILAKNSNYQNTMGSKQIGFIDISMMNELYQCKGKCGASAAACWNGGFPNPRSCGQCVCPSGYGGPLCNQRPSGCGSILTATASFQTLVDNTGDGRPASEADGLMKCNYWIQAPAGKKIEVRFKNINGIWSEGCYAFGVEIKTHANQMRTGYRFCSTQDVTLTSTLSMVPMITYTHSIYSWITIELEYRFVDGIPTTTTRPTTVCADTNTNCAIWKNNGYCSNTFYPIEARKSTCGTSCNLCGGGPNPNPNCADTNANCASWKQNGFCTNTFYTLEQRKSYCAQSCSLCNN